MWKAYENKIISQCLEQFLQIWKCWQWLYHFVTFSSGNRIYVMQEFHNSAAVNIFVLHWLLLASVGVAGCGGCGEGGAGGAGGAGDCIRNGSSVKGRDSLGADLCTLALMISWPNWNEIIFILINIDEFMMSSLLLYSSIDMVHE